MKKISKIVGILSAALLLGSIVGCTVEIETPQAKVNSPIITSYGVVFPVGYLANPNSNIVVTRQDGKDAAEKVVDNNVGQGAKYWTDMVGDWNQLKTGVDYTYRFYNVDSNQDEGFVFTADGNNIPVNAYSCVEQKVKFKEIAAKGSKLSAPTADEISVFANTNGTFNVSDVKGYRIGDFKITVDGIEVSAGSKLPAGAQKISVIRTWYNKYYEDSDPYEVEITVADADVDVRSNDYTVKADGILLEWFSNGTADSFTVERKSKSYAGYETEWEKVEIEVTNGTKYGDDHYFSAFDTTAEIGKQYLYRIVKSDGKTKDLCWNWITFGGNTVEKFTASTRDGSIVLKWFANNGDDFIIERSTKPVLSPIDNDEWEALDIEIKAETLYTGEVCYMATDSTVEIGRKYDYRLVNNFGVVYTYSGDNNHNGQYVSVSDGITGLTAKKINKNDVKLTWKMTSGKETEKKFTIYRAEGETQYTYANDPDLFKKLDIEYVYDPRTKEYSAIDANLADAIYSYIVVIDSDSDADNETVSIVVPASSVSIISGSTLSSYNIDKDIVVAWKGMKSSVKEYKLSYRTYDNKGIESDEKDLTATITSDGNDHYRAVIKAETFGKAGKIPYTAVRIYVNAYDADGKLVYPDPSDTSINTSTTLTIDQSVSSYASFKSLWGGGFSANNTSGTEVKVTLEGYNLADAKVSYCDSGSKITPIKMTKAAKDDPTDDWDTYEATVTLPTPEAGTSVTYTFIAVLPEDTAYNPNDMERTDNVWL